MRTAAGILMIVGALLGLTMIRGIAVSVGISATGFIPGLLGWLLWLWAFLVGGGGYYTLKRKSWGLSLTSGFLLLPMGTVLPFLIWTDASSSGELITPFAMGITTLFFVVGILPLIFVCLKKREWES